MRYQARGYDRFLHIAGVLGRASVVMSPLGGNAFDLPDDVELEPEVEAELAEHTTLAGAPPVLVEQGTGTPSLDTGHQPASPALGGPLPVPPKAGPGATIVAWRRYALSLRPPVLVTPDMGRDDIIRAVEAPPDDR